MAQGHKPCPLGNRPGHGERGRGAQGPHASSKSGPEATHCTRTRTRRKRSRARIGCASSTAVSPKRSANQGQATQPFALPWGGHSSPPSDSGEIRLGEWPRSDSGVGKRSEGSPATSPAFAPRQSPGFSGVGQLQRGGRVQPLRSKVPRGGPRKGLWETELPLFQRSQGRQYEGKEQGKEGQGQRKEGLSEGEVCGNEGVISGLGSGIAPPPNPAETSHSNQLAGSDLPSGASLNPFASLSASGWANMHLEHLGSLLLSLVSASPGVLQPHAALRVTSPPHSGESGKIPPRARNLLPFPLPSDTAEEYYKADEDTGTYKAASHLRQEYVRRPGLRAWLLLIITTLNLSAPAAVRPAQPSRTQRHAFWHLCEYVSHMCNQADAVVPDRCWDQFVSSRSISYSGECHLKAQKLTWLQIKHGLPSKQHCASISVLDLCEGALLEYFLHPSDSLVEEMPDTAPRSGMFMASREEGVLIAQNLLELGLVRVLSDNELIKIGGRPLLNGLFGVTKGKPVPEAPNLEVLRLIMNLTASNSVMKELKGDIPALPYFGQWRAIILAPTETMLWSFEDMVGCFHLFRLPDEWSPYFAFNMSFSANELGLPGNDKVWLGSRVMPMGWSNSMGVVQYLHRRLLTKATGSPQVCPLSRQALPLTREVRKDKPFPVLSSDSLTVSAFWQTYCDDFDLSELVGESPEFYESFSVPHEWHDVARSMYASANVPTSVDKAGVRESAVIRLGALVDGLQGRISPSPDKFGLLAGLTHYILTKPRVSKRVLQVVCGHWTNAFQFRREGSSYLTRVWSLIAKLPNYASIELPLPIKREFMSCLMLLPLMQINLRAPIDNILTVSDASETGGGVCASSRLTDLGAKAFASELANPPALGRDIVGLIALFDGIGGARRSFDLLGVELAAFATSEINEPASKIVRSAWPDVQEWGDIKLVGNEHIRSFLRSALHLKVIFIAAGSPCQDAKTYRGSMQVARVLCGLTLRFCLKPSGS